jgi:hypothetical protein
LKLADPEAEIQPLANVSLPSTVDGRWEDAVQQYLAACNAGFGAQVKSKMGEFVVKRDIEWLDALVIHERDLRVATLKTKDPYLMVGPIAISRRESPIEVLEIVREDREVEFRSVIDFDNPATLKRRFTIRSGTDELTASDQQVKLVVQVKPSEFADALNVRVAGNEIEPDEPFAVNLPDVFDVEFQLKSEFAAATGKEEISLRFADQKDQTNPLILVSDQAQAIRFGARFPVADRVELFVQTTGQDAISLGSEPGMDVTVPRLQPFSNRPREFQLGIRNRSGRDKSISIELFPVQVPRALVNESLPGRIPRDASQSNAVHPEVEAATLRYADSNPPFAVSLENELARNGERMIALTAPAPPGPAASTETGDGEGKGEAAKPAEPAPMGTALAHGIVCRWTEKDTAFKDATRRRYFWLELERFNSSMFLDQRATFFPTGSRPSLKIELSLSPQRIVPTPSPLACQIRTNVPGNRSLIAINPDPKTGFELGDSRSKGSFDVDLDPGVFEFVNPIHVFVDVNGESGVFIYEIEKSDLQIIGSIDIRDVRAEKTIFDFISATGTLPGEKEPFEKFPGEFIDIRPPDEGTTSITFRYLANFADEDVANSKLNVEFGKKDQNPAPLVRLTDHHVAFNGQPNQAGNLDLTTEITDHTDFIFPIGTLTWEMNSWVSGDRGRIAQSSQLFRFDRDPPRNGTLYFEGKRQRMTVGIGEIVSLFVDVQDDLTGVEKVDLYRDLNRVGRLENEEDLLIASQSVPRYGDANAGRWEIKLDTQKLVDEKKLELGTEILLIARATDFLKNQTDDDNPIGANGVALNLKKKALSAASKKAAAEKNRTSFNVTVQTIWENALGKQQPLPANRIKGLKFEGFQYVESKKKPNEFTFQEVPPGADYVISAQGETDNQYAQPLKGHVVVSVADKDISAALVLKSDGKLEPDEPGQGDAGGGDGG